MHTLYFVIHEESDDAEELLMNNAFICEGGYFSGGICDYFVVGGRWGDILKESGISVKPETPQTMELTEENCNLLTLKFPYVVNVETWIERDMEECSFASLCEDNYWRTEDPSEKWALTVIDYHM